MLNEKIVAQLDELTVTIATDFWLLHKHVDSFNFYTKIIINY